jgi:hypothetical protein
MIILSSKLPKLKAKSDPEIGRVNEALWLFWHSRKFPFEMEIVAESPTITPVELEPPAKRKRGRPKKAAVAGAPNIPEPSSVSLPTPATETNRFSGPMSLRPNRRVDVNKGDL